MKNKHDQSSSPEPHLLSQTSPKIASYNLYTGFYYKLKLAITLLAVILTSYQVYDLTTNRLQHSRNFIRYLNYYLLGHEDFDIYWAGQGGNNYPIHEYYQVGDVQEFLERLGETFMSFDDSLYGQVKLDKIVEQDVHKIYLQTKGGQIEEYPYVISQGFKGPFETENLNSIKDSILRSQQINIMYEPFTIQDAHLWHLTITISDYSDCSIFVQIHAKQSFAGIWSDHVSTFAIALALLYVLVKEYLQNPESLYGNLPDYMLCVILVNTFLFSFNQHSKHMDLLIMADGVGCLVAWLLVLKFLTKEDGEGHDYHISFLIKKSYILVGRIFVSFGPIFIAFVLFAYIMFCREAWQFSSFRRTFLNLFYISYYNMTYESFIVTSRTNPISIIFFVSFVILFTMCVYSGMLVSVFCSYVWNKKESKVKEDIINNLKIQCSQCDHKYKYVDCVQMAKLNPKASMRMSVLLQVDFTSSEERYKYKLALQRKIKNMTDRLIQSLEQNENEVQRQRSATKKRCQSLSSEATTVLFDSQIRLKQALRQMKETENTSIDVQLRQIKGQSKKNI